MIKLSQVLLILVLSPVLVSNHTWNKDGRKYKVFIIDI